MCRKLLCMFFTLALFACSNLSQTRNELFPLTAGSSYIYKYNSHSGSSDFYGDSESKTDTGWVKYYIEGSELHDTLNYWNITVSDSVYTSIYKFRSWTNPPSRFDSSYWTISTHKFILKEDIRNSHRLYCTSSYNIWDSPVYSSGGFYNIPVHYRYSDTAASIVLDYYNGNSRTIVKSLTKVGITSFSYTYSYGQHSSIDSYKNAELIDYYITSVSDKAHMTDGYFLGQNYPNPFNPITFIKYSIPLTSHVELKVFDLLGREISTLINEQKSPGEYEIKFDGSSLPSGIYIYTIQAGNFRNSKKLLLLK